MVSPIRTDLPLLVFFGDSRARDWPVPAAAGFAFLNRGIGGNTTRQVLERIEEQIAPLNPRAIVLQVGINDLKMIPLEPETRDAIVARCKDTIRSIVEKLAGLGASVILTNVFPTGEPPADRVWSGDVAIAVVEVNAYLGSLAGSGVTLLDAHTALVGEDGKTLPGYSRDLMHLNSAGYARLNTMLIPVLGEILAGPGRSG
jgi:lysophospholipase L1-like esterase